MERTKIYALGLSLFILPAGVTAQDQAERQQNRQQKTEMQNQDMHGSERQAGLTQEQRSQRDAQRGRMDSQQRNMQNQSIQDSNIQDGDQTLSDAAQVYSRLLQQQDTAERSRLEEQANCIAVFPNVSRAALVVGGARGNGVATCKTANGQWSKVAPMNITSASVGAQVGATSSDMAIFFLSDNAKQKLQSGNVNFGADLEVALGESGRSLGADLAGKDVVAIASSDGIFAGASLSGARLTTDTTRITEMYGSEQRAKQLLSESADGQQNQEIFISALPTSGSAHSKGSAQ